MGVLTPLPDYDINCGHHSLIPGIVSSDAWVLKFNLPFENSIDSESKPYVKVFPNPAFNILNISSNIKINEVEIRIYNLLGVVKLSDIVKNIDGYKIDISKFENGVYIIQLLGKDKSYFASYFIIEH